MESYILVAIFAYLLFAVNGIIDKLLLGKGIPQPAVFAFYVGLGSSLVILLSPFGIALPSFKIIIVSLISGLSFFFALIALYTSLKHASTSRVLPTVGALVPLATFPLSYFIVGERFTGNEIYGMAFLVIGSFLLAIGARAYSRRHHWFSYAMLAGGLFALSFTLSKIVYLDQEFISGLIWTRLGLVAGAFLILINPKTRTQIVNTTTQAGRGIGILFLIGQVVGALAGILQNYAVAKGSVTIVNALQGTQFALLFLLALILSKWYSKILNEDVSGMALIRKISAIALLIVGLILIA